MSVYSSSKKSSQASFGSRSLVNYSSAVESRRASVAQYSISRDYDVLSYRSWMPDYEDTLLANEKQTMQILNDRLASYLKKVHSLEQANRKLELQIKEFYDERKPVGEKDMSDYFEIITHLRSQIQSSYLENASLRLQVDNVKLTAEDFQIKHDTEMNMRMIGESDLARLRGVLGSIKLSIGDLQNHFTGLKEELMFLKKSHEEDMLLLRQQQSGSVNVEMDCTTQTNLDQELKEMRIQYETLIEKNRREVELWFKNKVSQLDKFITAAKEIKLDLKNFEVETLQTQLTTSCTEIKTSQNELTTLRRSVQSLEIELQGAFVMKQQMEQSVADSGNRYVSQLNQLQLNIHMLQEELQKLNVSIQEQATEYQLLLNIKMRLEIEIAEYRRLLEGEAETATTSISSSTSLSSKTTTVNETVTETTETQIIQEIVEEEHNPHLQRRVKVIVEELVDGEVISSSVDEKVQDLN